MIQFTRICHANSANKQENKEMNEIAHIRETTEMDILCIIMSRSEFMANHE